MAVDILDIPERYRHYCAQALANLYETYPNATFEHVCICRRPGGSALAAKGYDFSYLWFYFLTSDFEVMQCSSDGVAGWGFYQTYVYNSWSQGDVTCPTCNGARTVYNQESETWVTCSKCGGTGKVKGQIIVQYWSADQSNGKIGYFPRNNGFGSFQYRPLVRHGDVEIEIVYCDAVLQFDGVILYPPALTADGTPEPTYSYCAKDQTLTLYTSALDGNDYD